jgi:tRNA threonylcarbamoyladenosine biosynthesis protein TsaE
MMTRDGISCELSEPALEGWGREIGRVAAEGRVFVCLYGDLGAGKSTLARAACRGAGVAGPVPSPTFTLVNEYECPDGTTVRHADLYRIDGSDGLPDMGWAGLVQSDEVVFVEWADRADGHLPADRWDIRLEFVADRARRRVTARACGSAPPVPPFPCGDGGEPW